MTTYELLMLIAAVVTAVGGVGFVVVRVSPYPPGTPRLIPGERVTETIIDYLHKGCDAGMFVLDPSDTELKTLRVVDGRI